MTEEKDRKSVERVSDCPYRFRQSEAPGILGGGRIYWWGCSLTHKEKRCPHHGNMKLEKCEDYKEMIPDA